jgi:hypothetical protein
MEEDIYELLVSIKIDCEAGAMAQDEELTWFALQEAPCISAEIEASNKKKNYDEFNRTFIYPQTSEAQLRDARTALLQVQDLDKTEEGAEVKAPPKLSLEEEEAIKSKCSFADLLEFMIKNATDVQRSLAEMNILIGKRYNSKVYVLRRQMEYSSRRVTAIEVQTESVLSKFNFERQEKEMLEEILQVIERRALVIDVEKKPHYNDLKRLLKEEQELQGKYFVFRVVYIPSQRSLFCQHLCTYPIFHTL